MKAIENYLEKAGLRWTSFEDQTTLGESIKWKEIESETKNYLELGREMSLKKYKMCVLNKVMEPGWVTFSDIEKVDRLLSFNGEFNCFKEKLFDYFDLSLGVSQERVTLSVELKALRVRAEKICDDEWKELFDPEYKLKAIFDKEEAKFGFASKVIKKAKDFVARVNNRQDILQSIVIDGLYEAIMEDFSEKTYEKVVLGEM